MIGHLTGTLKQASENTALIDVGGVGYVVHLSSGACADLPSKGKVVSVWTHLAVRENALDLYGFATQDERALFELLINVPGIGPKSGIGILSLATVETLTQSIATGDTTYLTKVSGIGKKSAEKIVLELKDKLKSDVDGADLGAEADAIEALQSLGYSLKESREALKKVPTDVKGANERIKTALKQLGK